jgi:hypothetical protein
MELLLALLWELSYKLDNALTLRDSSVPAIANLYKAAAIYS